MDGSLEHPSAGNVIRSASEPSTLAVRLRFRKKPKVAFATSFAQDLRRFTFPGDLPPHRHRKEEDEVYEQDRPEHGQVHEPEQRRQQAERQRPLCLSGSRSLGNLRTVVSPLSVSSKNLELVRRALHFCGKT